jgi:hypothetical protein
MVRKGMHGLKQSPRNWYQLKKRMLMEIGFRKSLYDHCLFTYDSKDADDKEIECYIGLYVDDGILIGKDKCQLHAAMASIKDSFKLTVTADT